MDDKQFARLIEMVGQRQRTNNGQMKFILTISAGLILALVIGSWTILWGAIKTLETNQNTNIEKVAKLQSGYEQTVERLSRIEDRLTDIRQSLLGKTREGERR